MNRGTSFAAVANRLYGACAALFGLAVVASASIAAAQGTPYIVRDLGQHEPGTGVAVRRIGAVGARVLFAGNDGVHGFEPWISDGTEEGTRLVKDIQPGPRGGVLTDFTAIGTRMYFVVDDGVHGHELWISDGTEAGTHLVHDVAPGGLASVPHLLTPLDDLLFFVADDGAHGDELWVTDGSDAGTALVADVRSGAGGARIKEIVAAGGLVWFVANDGVVGAELWSSDGTPEGTQLVADLRPGADGSEPADLVAFGGGVLFAAHDGASGDELWSADPISGAHRVADILPGRGGSHPAGMVVAGELAYFTATTSDVDGAQLWATDGTDGGTYRVSDMQGEWGAGLELKLTAAIGDTLYFVTYVDDGRGAALWRTDGTEPGTQLVADLKPYRCSDEFRAMVAMGDRLMLVARSRESDDELWTSDGTTAGTYMVKDIFPGQTGGHPSSMVVAGDTLFFGAIDGLHGRELWKSDGTEAGTMLVRDILLGSNDGGVETYAYLVAQRERVLFPDVNSAVWQSDGTFAGTTALAIPSSLYAFDLLPAGDFLFFEGIDRPTFGNRALMRYDGASLSTVAELGSQWYSRLSGALVTGDTLWYGARAGGYNRGALWRTPVDPTAPVRLRSFTAASPEGLMSIRGTLYFRGGDQDAGKELWKTDGTPEGTVPVADINPGRASSDALALGNVGRRILLIADDGTHGLEPYVTDGTAAGTRLLRDIFPGSGSSWPTGGARLGGAFYFGAYDVGGGGLWRTDGTPAGTFRVKHFTTSPGGSYPGSFFRLGDLLLFAASDAATGNELWRTDGTEAGTFILADAVPGPGDAWPSNLVVVGDVAYFTVYAANGTEHLWVTDGTVAGTRLAADVSSGAPGAGVVRVASRNGQLLFVANDGVHGTELWALTCGNGVLDPAEACDDGAQNGAALGCCTGTCAIRDGAGDACDPVEGSLVVRRARVQYDAPGGATTGRLTADGLLDADAALPLSLDAGLTAFIGSGAGFSLPIAWSPAECGVQTSGVLRCARSGAVATFRPVAGAAPGAQRLRFALRVSGLDVAGPLATSLDVKLRTGDRLDRAGSIADCVARRAALVCDP